MTESDDGLLHAVQLAAQFHQDTWRVYETAVGTRYYRHADDPPVVRSSKIYATVKHLTDNIIQVTYAKDGRVERLYV